MTPMFEQFHELKAQHPDAILFFRMGDFYETFFEDAEVTARELELTLTARNKHEAEPIPMAGVPHHAASGYIQRLVDAGYRVAIAEQVEDPALAKGLVRREVVRVVTPGVTLDPTALAAHEPNYLCAICHDGERFGLAFLDASTGDLRVTTVLGLAEAVGEVQRLEPREVLLGPDLQALHEALPRHRAVHSHLEAEAWQVREACREIADALGVADPAGFGLALDDPALRAAGAALRYARDTCGGRLGNVHHLHVYRPSAFMVLDETTRRNLELFRTLLGGQRRGSLLALVDRAVTPMGSRLLRDWLCFPLLDEAHIGRRHDAVALLVGEPGLRDDLRRSLREVADIERIVARVTQGSAHARDLAALRRSLDAVPAAVDPLRPWPALHGLLPGDPCGDVAAELARWVVDDPPLAITEGGILQPAAHQELQELTTLALEGRGVIQRLEAREREATGIASLKIRSNKVFGYYLEVTKAQLHRVPGHYLRKQTLSTGERYITPELKELEERVLGADERRKQLEHALFLQLRERVAACSERLVALARSLAGLDALAALAEVAVRHRWVRPTLVADNRLAIRAGRHPVVEAALDEERFVPNDVTLDARDRRLIILTGPNMSGKSTVLRQVALIVLLAQAGSFVPAEHAEIGLCDRIFTRVGAADDLARGQSTFMVEMAETAAILHHATARSLVVLDEIGRGTSTYDGLAIAWSVAEDLSGRIGCRALFATHYHELCELAAARPGVVNQSVAVHESGDRIVFLRRLKDGGASRSYGIQCARLAGLPRPVVARAQDLLRRFEKHAPRGAHDQLSLFGAAGAPPEAASEPEPPPDPLREALAEVDPDTLSPRQALEILYRLRDLA